MTADSIRAASAGPDAAGGMVEGTPDEKRRRRLRAGLQIGGSLVILALMFLFLPRDELFAAFGRLPTFLLALAIPLYLLLHLGGAFKWRMLVNTASGGLGRVPAIRCYYIGLFGSTFLPSIVGGDFVRAGTAMRLARSKAGVVLGSVIDRTLDVVAPASVAGVGALMLPAALPPESRTIWLGLAFTVAAAGVAGALIIWLAPARKLPRKARRILVRLRQRGRELAKAPGRVAAALAIGFTLQATLAMMNAWIGTFIGIETPLYVWLFVWPMAKVSALLPITQGGIGVREAALAALFAPFGVPAVLAVAAGLAFQGVVIGGGLLAGLIALLLGRIQRVPGTPRSESAPAGARVG